jgi:ABC-type antimicrobial peptide transport system permease subunit
MKALVLGLIYWFLLSVLGGLGDLSYGLLYYGGSVVEGLVVALVFSYLLAWFFRRLSPKEPAMAGTTAPQPVQ